jgi:hypothetical protein
VGRNLDVLGESDTSVPWFPQPLPSVEPGNTNPPTRDAFPRTLLRPPIRQATAGGASNYYTNPRFPFGDDISFNSEISTENLDQLPAPTIDDSSHRATNYDFPVPDFPGSFDDIFVNSNIPVADLDFLDQPTASTMDDSSQGDANYDLAAPGFPVFEDIINSRISTDNLDFPNHSVPPTIDDPSQSFQQSASDFLDKFPLVGSPPPQQFLPNAPFDFIDPSILRRNTHGSPMITTQPVLHGPAFPNVETARFTLLDDPPNNSEPPTESFEAQVLAVDTNAVPSIPNQEEPPTLSLDVTQIGPSSNSTMRYVTSSYRTKIRGEMDFDGEISDLRGPARSPGPVYYGPENPLEAYQSEFQVEIPPINTATDSQNDTPQKLKRYVNSSTSILLVIGNEAQTKIPLNTAIINTAEREWRSVQSVER